MSASPSSFLQLPPEIRNKIYSLTLIFPQAAGRQHHTHTPSHTLTSNICPALLCTNHQIYAEASSFLYGRNLFIAHPALLTGLPFAFDARKPIISLTLIAQIRKYRLLVRLDCDPFYDAAHLEKAFTGVETLEVEVCQREFGASDHSVLYLLLGVRGVKRAKVYGSISSNFGAYLENVMMSRLGSAVPSYEKMVAGAADYKLL